MFHSDQIHDLQVRALFHTELAASFQEPQQVLWLNRDDAGLLPRFALYHARLCQLPRRLRRTLERRWHRSLPALALLLALGQAPQALARTIPVDDINCTLVNAITAANTNQATGGCLAGSGADVLFLKPNSTHVLTKVNNVFNGNNGLPVVTSEVTIEGNNSTIKRDPGAPEFRILAVGFNGNLLLNQATVTGGISTETLIPNGYGGGIASFGKLTIDNSVVSGNVARGGAGVFIGDSVYSGRISNSSILNNKASSTGGGILSIYSFQLINSTVCGNSAAVGGGLYLSDGTGNLLNCTITRNQAEKGGGLFIDDYAAVTINNSIISGNMALTGSEVYTYYGSVSSVGSFNLLGHSGITNLQALNGRPFFVPSVTDITATSDGNQPTALNKILNPILTRSGGRTKTHNLVKGSPAVDAITTGCPPPSTDQRGVPRPQGVKCDIGAVEMALCNGQVATLVGTAGPDVLMGTSRPDIIQGFGGSDKIFGFGGNDIIYGWGGRDLLKGGPGDDKLFGQGGNDTLDGGDGLDACNGGSGIDAASACESVVAVP